MCKMFLNLHIHKEHDEKLQLHLITHFKIHTLNQAYLLLMLNATVQLLNCKWFVKVSKTERAILL